MGAAYVICPRSYKSRIYNMAFENTKLAKQGSSNLGWNKVKSQIVASFRPLQFHESDKNLILVHSRIVWSAVQGLIKVM